MERIIIAAVADNMAIGKGNAMPWHLREDLQFFKRNTSGYPVIMGRKTFESLGRPLPKRLNIIVSRSLKKPDDMTDGVCCAESLSEAYAAAENYMKEHHEAESCGMKCFVIGGGEIYRQAMDTADRLLITHVHTAIGDADTFFPAIDPAVWHPAEKSGIRRDPESGLEFEFVTYTRA